MDTTINPNANYFNSGKGGNPTAITPESLQSVTPIQLPQMPTVQPTSLKDIPITDFMDSGPSQVEAAKATKESKLDSLKKFLFNKSTDTAQAETTAGIPQLTTDYNELNDQLRQIQAEQVQLSIQENNIPLQQQEDILKRGITTKAGLAPLTASELRKNAIAQNNLTSKGLLVSAMAETARGKIAQAEASVDRAIKLKYEPIEQEIAYQKEALDRIYKDLDREDRKKADERKIILDERSRVLNIEREDEKIKQSFINEAIAVSAKNGVTIPPLLLNRAQQASNPSEALSIIAPYTVDAEAKADALLDQKYKQAQISNIYSSIAKSDAETKKLLNEIDAPAMLNTIDITTPQGRNTGNLLSIISSNKIDAGTKTQIANTLGVINSLSDLATQRQTGKFEGLSPLQGVADFVFPEFLMSAEGTENRGYLDAINLKVQQWASGASLTKQQTDQVNNLTPKKTDSDAKIKTKMNNLANFMLTQAQSQIQSQGLNYTPEKVDFFLTDTLIQGLSPEQKAELQAEGLL